MPLTNKDISLAEIKQRIRSKLPKSAFEVNPLRMLWVPFWISVALAAGYVILMTPVHWSIKVVLGVIIGNSWAILNFIAHEVVHGGMGGSKKVQDFVGNLCGFPVLMPAHLWQYGHIRRHHAYTNQDLKDTDTLGLHHRYVNKPGAQKLIDKYPGSGLWASLRYFAYGFTFQNLDRALKTKGEKGRSVRQKVGMMAVFWLAVAFMSGFDFVFTVVIPFITANAIILSYIVTQHWIRPLSDNNNAMETTLGITQPKWLESMHFNNSCHLEHHLFPAMPFSKLPLVRQALVEEFPDKIAIMPHWQALKWVFKTPRVYADNNHLVDLRHPDKWFDLKAFERTILDPDKDLAKCSVADFLVTKTQWKGQHES